MKLSAYYNEIDAYCCDWLSNLMDAGHITPGKIDNRSIEELTPDDLEGYERCHFFAGIGGWELALNWAGWTGPAWSGSCPCQPLSSAGQQKGHADKRHLWPAFQSLIAKCQPPTVFGEQVASKDGREWFAAVRADLEHVGYACGCADLAAAGVGAPHIRQRLFWVADASGPSRQRGAREFLAQEEGISSTWESNGDKSIRLEDGGEIGRMAHGNEPGHAPVFRSGVEGVCEEGTSERALSRSERGSPTVGMGDAIGAGLEGHPRHGDRGGESGRQQEESDGSVAEAGALGSGMGNAESGDERGTWEPREGDGRESTPRRSGAWDNAILIPCADGKARPVEPSIQPLASGVPARVGRLRAYGNAIVPQVAAVFVQAFIEIRYAPDCKNRGQHGYTSRYA